MVVQAGLMMDVLQEIMQQFQCQLLLLHIIRHTLARVILSALQCLKWLLMAAVLTEIKWQRQMELLDILDPILRM